MKISKLFHWLYAILMLLPFAFFVPSVLYYAFNDNAEMRNVEVPIYDTVVVDFNQLIHNGDFEDTDYWNCPNSTLIVADNIGTFTRTSSDEVICYYTLDNVYEAHKYLLCGYANSSISGSLFFSNALSYSVSLTANTWENFSSVIISPHTYSGISLRINISGIVGDILKFKNVQLFDLTQMFGSGNEPTYDQFKRMFPLDYYDYVLSETMQITYDTGETEQLIENISVINYAWESIWDLPLFSWTKGTFVSQSFVYLTGIFGLSVNNSLNYVFGYFVTISIVWLVFDLLLYVPMLAHNWIDKARIE